MRSSNDKDIALHDCSSNLAAHASIGNERQWTRKSLQTVHDSGIEIDMIISDPDSNAHRAAEDLFLEGETPPLHQLDTRHVSSLQRKIIKEKSFSKEMIPRGWSRKKHSLNKVFLGDDQGENILERKDSWEDIRLKESQPGARFSKVRTNDFYSTNSLSVC